MMAYNVLLHSSARKAAFFFMFGCDAFMPTLLKLLLPKLRCIGAEGCKIQLDAIREIYMMAVLNLKTARGKDLPLIQDPDKAEFKVGAMTLLKNHAPTNTFDTMYRPSFRISKWSCDKALSTR